MRRCSRCPGCLAVWLRPDRGLLSFPPRLPRHSTLRCRWPQLKAEPAAHHSRERRARSELGAGAVEALVVERSAAQRAAHRSVASRAARRSVARRVRAVPPKAPRVAVQPAEWALVPAGPGRAPLELVEH